MSWVCIESGLEVVVEILNYLASAVTAAQVGSPVSFFSAFGLNVLMIVLEFIELRRTRKHGGKQTPWDRFWFGQWQASTRKNFFAKYHARMMLGIHFFINLAALPVVISTATDQQSCSSVSVSECDNHGPKMAKVRPGTVESGLGLTSRLPKAPLRSLLPKAPLRSVLHVASV